MDKIKKRFSQEKMFKIIDDFFNYKFDYTSNEKSLTKSNVITKINKKLKKN
tara:strand:- start:2764 stop:2916 length:153 start_codon:yes stop_codon:yes gene_type:complete